MRRRGYTLVEMLIVVAILGIMGALVVPSMSSAGVFRARSAVRTLVSDITFAQGDAMAFQQGRAVVFYPDDNRYVVVEVTGPVLDPVNDAMIDTGRPSGIMDMTFNAPRFGGARMTSAVFDAQPVLIFDAMGAPVTEPMGTEPSVGGSVTIDAPDGRQYWVRVDGFTGHVTTGVIGP